MTPQIATRAYELYEQQGHRDGQSVENWETAEREIQRDRAEAEPQSETKAESKPGAKVEAKPEAEIEPKPEAKVELQSDAKVELKTEAKSKTPSDLTPQIIARVYALYEQLGREDVRAVEDLEKAQWETRQDQTKPEAKAEPREGT